MSEKQIVTISRYWNNPKIHTKVNFLVSKQHLPGSSEDKGSIQLSIELEDYINALVEETQGILTTCTKAQLKVKLHKASKAVLSKIKEESAKVMT